MQSFTTKIRGLSTTYTIIRESVYWFELYSAPCMNHGRFKSKRAAIKRINELEQEHLKSRLGLT